MEQAFVFSSHDKQLVGISHQPLEIKTQLAVLIVVGGPQTRVGSHRQFVLLSRFLARSGVPSMRFDYAGMGDSQGEKADFLNASDDIIAAINECKQRLKVDKVVIWGLCDAASAMLIASDYQPLPDVEAMILLNPWVQTKKGKAKTIVKHYYANRLLQRGFWKKIIKLEFNFVRSSKELSRHIFDSFNSEQKNSSEQKRQLTSENYVQSMLDGVQKFTGALFLITSGNDLTAREFNDLISNDKAWKNALQEKVHDNFVIPRADHTFSEQQWREIVENVTLKWVLNFN